jgi:branched-chain amino acid transport system ATP-binding protein
MLEIAGLDVFHDEVAAVRGLSLEVRRGEIVTLIGANGAGKSTTLRAISGLVRARAGAIRYEGAEIGKLTPDAIVRRGLAHVPEGRHVFPGLTVEENLKVGAHVVPDAAALRAGIERAYALFPRLRERRRQLAGALSGGEQQMLALGRAIMSAPKLLLLDEPSLGLAPRIIDEVTEAIAGFRNAGITMLLVEQNASLALSVSDRGYVMERGTIVHEGRAAELASSPIVAASYLGDLTGPYDGARAEDGPQDRGRSLT